MESDALLQFLLEIISSPAMLKKQEFQPRPLAMLSQLAGLAKQFSDALDNGLDLAPTHECIQARREMRFGRQSTANPQREPGFGFSIQRARDRSQPDIVDLRISAPNPAARDRDFEL